MLTEIISVRVLIVREESAPGMDRSNSMFTHYVVDLVERANLILVGPLIVPESQRLGRLGQGNGLHVDFDGNHVDRTFLVTDVNLSLIGSGVRIALNFHGHPELHRASACDIENAWAFQIGGHIHNANRPILIQPFLPLPGSRNAAHDANLRCCDAMAVFTDQFRRAKLQSREFFQCSDTEAGRFVFSRAGDQAQPGSEFIGLGNGNRKDQIHPVTLKNQIASLFLLVAGYRQTSIIDIDSLSECSLVPAVGYALINTGGCGVT